MQYLRQIRYYDKDRQLIAQTLPQDQTEFVGLEIIAKDALHYNLSAEIAEIYNITTGLVDGTFYKYETPVTCPWCQKTSGD